ncbi:MAG: LCP family protein [Actinomycetes bacterium]|jgi:hypothetical protein
MTNEEIITEAAKTPQEISRRRLVLLSSIVLALVSLLAVAWFFVSRPTASDPSPQPTPTPTASVLTQPTLLFQLKDRTLPTSVGNALTSVGGPTGKSNDIAVPSSVLVDVGGVGEILFGETVTLADGNGAGNALSDVTGIRIDITLQMDALAFSGLVDAVGGVITDVDVEVVDVQPDGTKVVVLPAGKGQILQGPKAAAYATYRAPGETLDAQMARFDRVFRLVLAQLPSDPSKMEEIFTSLGASSRATVPTPELAAYLVRLHEAVVSGTIVYRDLPVVPVGAGQFGATRVNILGTAAMARKLFPDALRVPGPNSKVRVLVQNGIGLPAPMASARQALIDAGYAYVNGGNAATFGQVKSTILVPDPSVASLGWGADIAATLGVPNADVDTAKHGQTVADVIVVLGQDFGSTASPAAG